MKKHFFCLIFLLFYFFGNAQQAGDYALIPGAVAKVYTGGKIRLLFNRLAVNGDLKNGSPDIKMPDWRINGIIAGQTDPAEGTLTLTDGFIGNSVDYTAPDKLPPTNPVTVSVSFHPAAESKEVVTLICNITVVSAFKVTAEMELTSPSGIHISLSGESMTELSPLADGTYWLEPIDGKSDMNMTVKNFTMPKGVTLISPWNYKVPFLLTIGKPSGGSSPAEMVISYFGPKDQKEQYRADGITINTAMIQQFFFLAYMNEIIKTQKTNRGDAENQKEWAKRMQEHKGDPAYFKTEQGQADLKQLQTLQQEMSGKINNPDNLAQHLAQQIAQKAQQDPGYVGSAQYQKDLQQEEAFAQGNKDVGGATPTAGIALHGALNIEGNFNAGVGNPMQVSKESSSGGAFHATIKIKVEKT